MKFPKERDGLIRIRYDKNDNCSWNLLKNNKLLFKENFSWISKIDDDNLRLIKIDNGAFNLIDSNGNFIFEKNKKFITISYNFSNDVYRTIDDEKWYYKDFLRKKLIKELIK